MCQIKYDRCLKYFAILFMDIDIGYANDNSVSLINVTFSYNIQ